MSDILVVGQDMDRVVAVVRNTVMDRFSCSDEYIQEHMAQVELAIQGNLADRGHPYNQVYQVGRVDRCIQVHRDIQGVLACLVDLRNSLEYTLVHKIVGTDQDT